MKYDTIEEAKAAYIASLPPQPHSKNVLEALENIGRLLVVQWNEDEFVIARKDDHSCLCLTRQGLKELGEKLIELSKS